MRGLPEKLKDAEPGYAILLELEPQYYLACASIVMCNRFGRPGTKLGDVAFKALKELFKDASIQ